MDFVVEQLTQRQIPFVRFNTEDFPCVATITLQLGNKNRQEVLQFPNNPQVKGSDITSVWYRRPAPYELPLAFSPEIRSFAEQETRDFIRGLWESLRVTWVNHPENNRRANVKIHQLEIASALGFHIPDTLITNNPEIAEQFYYKHAGQVIIKPLSRGVLETDPPQGFYTSLVTPDHLRNISQVKYTPVLLQQLIPKDVELRITIVRSEIFTAEIHSQKLESTKVDWRHDPWNVEYRIHELPKDIKDKCLQLTDSFGLHFGTIDMILTPKGDYVFLEINPNGQWTWIEELTELPISEALINLLSRV